MIREDIREEIKELGFENSLLFDNPDFDDSIIGYTEDGQIVYNFDQMAIEYAQDTGCTLEEAVEFIEYNTLRALPYADIDTRPIVIFNFMSNT